MLTPLVPADLPIPPPGKSGWPWTTDTAPLPASLPDGSPWPKISVVTPSYNQGEFLEETIRSVLLQGYPNLEYIIMDGGSSDQSVEIIRKYEPWLAHWVSERDGGQTNAINRGWRVASGDAVTWLNSDDTLEPGALVAAVTALYAEPDIEIVHGQAHTMDEASRITGMIKRNRFVPEDVLVRAINPFPQPGFLMRRRLLDQVGWLDESMHFCMDFDYWTRLALAGVRAQYVDRVLANFREHGSSKTNTQYKRQITECLRIYEKAFGSSLPKNNYLAQRDRARSFAELQVARIAYYKATDAKLTRLHAWRHIRASRLRPSLRGVFLLLGSLGGNRGLQAGYRLHMWYKRMKQH